MDSENRLETLERRMQDLVREVAWHRRAWGVALVAAMAVAVVGAGSTKVEKEIQASRFTLVGAGGAVRGSLGVEPDGSAAVRLTDQHGMERFAASVSDAGASLNLSERDRKIAAKLVVEGGVPRLALSDRTGNDRMWVALRLGSPAIQFIGPDGVPRSGIATMNDDSGVAVISGIVSGTPGLVLYDKERKIVWSAP